MAVLDLQDLLSYIMELQVQIKMNPNLFLRDPESTELGKVIIRKSIEMIHEIGIEAFTFKKLAVQVNSTEASIYRYFENKHRLLTYITTWFWTWLEYQLVFHTNNLIDPKTQIEIVIKLLTFQADDRFVFDYIDKNTLHQIVISEGDKAYLTKHVTEDNNARLFKPYKDLCHRIAEIFRSYNPEYAYPHSLASTLVETAHHQYYFQKHLPSLTDFGRSENLLQLETFLKDMVFNVLDNGKK